MIEITNHGFAVVQGDSHIGKWVKECGNLAHDRDAIPKICSHLKPGFNVLDIGANIGSHSIAYSQAVGPTGRVWAFEPNPKTYEALAYNMAKFCPDNVKCMRVGLSDQPGVFRIKQSENVGASMLFPLDEENAAQAETTVVTLDDVFLEDCGVRIDFLKADVEGYESRVLRGGERLIRRDKPIMWIEVNASALVLQGTTDNDLIIQIMSLGYTLHPTGNSPQYDVLCLPVI